MDIPVFLSKVASYRTDGWRLSVINATSVQPTDELVEGAFDVSWSFARDREFEHLRHRVFPGEEVPSISDLYGAAFLYENEMRELFGINVTGMNLDLKGQLYHGACVLPFSPRAIRARLEAQGKTS
jgi:ech hydrogenase subunit D